MPKEHLLLAHAYTRQHQHLDQSPAGAEYDIAIGAWVLTESAALVVEAEGVRAAETTPDVKPVADRRKRAALESDYVGSARRNPAVVVFASRSDLGCDYVVSALRAQGVAYIRLNSEDLPRFNISLDPIAGTVTGDLPGASFVITQEDLRGIYFRQPIYAFPIGESPRQEQLARAQWSAFVRSFLVFDHCRWVNYPPATYLAQHKAVQLAAAKRLGLAVPPTLIVNGASELGRVSAPNERIAVKGLDTVFTREKGIETLGRTSLLTREEIIQYDLSSAPFFVQKALENKLDLRVTVVEDQVWCASITLDGKAIDGDWRWEGARMQLNEYVLPKDIASRCIELTRHLGLRFSGIDLVLWRDEFVFLELNPTGAWATLARSLNLPIAPALARCLIGEVY